MSTQAQHETMLRKPILMPPSMIKKVNGIAKQKKVSFAEVVREAVNAFSEKPSSEDELILDALAETMVQTTENLIKKMDEIEKRLDETHALVEVQ
jgi:ribosome recycling factor